MPVPESQRAEFTAMVLANDRILKAMLVLLSIKDEHLYEELMTVFQFARSQQSPIGEGPQRMWDHTEREMEIVGELSRKTDARDVAQ